MHAARSASLPRLPDRVALLVLGSIVVTLLAGSSAPTPLYGRYQASWGFSPITTTVVFGVYAIAVLLALLVLGRLSDHVGRRPVLLVALAIQVVAMVVFVFADGVPALLGARVLQGVSTGAATAALGAGMIDFDRDQGRLANAVAPTFGTAAGAIGSGLAVQLLPAPTQLIYLALLAAFVLQALAVAAMRETAPRTPGALRSLRPRLALPSRLRGAFAVAAPVLFGVWALAGLYGALAPAVIRGMFHADSAILAVLSLAIEAVVAAACVLGLRRIAPSRVLVLGIVAMIASGAVALVAVLTGSGAVFLVGSALGGVAFGSGLQGAISTVVPLAEPGDRAGVLALVYMASYLGLGVPAVIAGVLVVHGGGLTSTAAEYGGAIVGLGALALAARVAGGDRSIGRDAGTVDPHGRGA